MNIIVTMGEALPMWLISGPHQHGETVTAWHAKTGPWQIRVTKWTQTPGQLEVSLSYWGRYDQRTDLNAEDGERITTTERSIWKTRGPEADLDHFLAAAKDELEYAAAIPSNIHADAPDALIKQAKKIADALEKKPELRNQVIRLLGAWKVIT